jgi:putative membrane protein
MKAVKLIKLLILFSFGLFLINLTIGGEFVQYVHPRFKIALLLAGIFFFLLTVVQVVNTFLQKEVYAHHHCEAHSHPADLKHELVVCVLLALPLVFALCLPSSSLGSDMVDKKTSNPAVQRGTAAQVEAGQNKEWNPMINDDLFLANMMVLYAKPADYAGKDIEYSGFVYHEDDFPDNTFLLARYAIVCCTADAQVTGLLCRFPESEKINNDQWVRIKGSITVESYQGNDIPLVEVSSLQYIKTPDNPYVY